MKKRSLILILSLVVLCLLLTACGCRHEWNEATCTRPQTCALCQETQGQALGHKWLDATCEEPETCARCEKTAGDPLGHQWVEATCRDAKECTVCGATDGQALGHQWTEATCTEPKRCTVCGTTSGTPSEHSWLDANCKMPKMCSVCGITEGEPAEHVSGEWTDTGSSVETATLKAARYCTVCGDLLEEQTVELTTMHEGDIFFLSPSEVVTRLNAIFALVEEPYESYTQEDADGDLALVVKNGSGDVCSVGWFESPSETVLKPRDADSGDIASLLLIFDETTDETVDDLYITLVCLIRTLDPALSTSEAEDVALKISEVFGSDSSYTFNDITYKLSKLDDGTMTLYITLLD